MSDLGDGERLDDTEGLSDEKRLGDGKQRGNRKLFKLQVNQILLFKSSEAPEW